MKTIKPLAACSLLLFSGFSGFSHARQPELATLLDEDTLLYLEIPSIPQLQEDWEGNPFYELFQREDIKAFIEDLKELLKSDDDFKEGFSGMEDFLSEEEDQEIMEGLLSGQVAFGLSRIDFLNRLPGPMAAPDEALPGKKPIPNMWLIFNYEDEELYDKLVKDMEEEEEEFIEHEDFNIILNAGMVVAFNDDIAVMTNSEETARRLITRYNEENNQPSLADHDNFESAYLRLYENAEIYYYLDLTFIADLAADAATEYQAVLEPMVQQGQLAPSNNILEALGLEALQCLSAGIDLDPSELRFKNLFMVESNNGFVGKLLGHYGDSLPDTSFLGEDLRQASASSYNITGMLRDLEATVAAISPFAGQMYGMQKAQFEQMLSIQIDEALINNFSGSVYVAAGETPNTAAAALIEQLPGMGTYLDQGSAIILGINDRISLEALVDSMLAAFGQQERILKQEYLGVSNYTLNSPTPGPGPSFFISDQHFIFEQNNPDWAKLVVSMMQNPGAPIFERRDVRDALGELPPDPLGVNYTDAEKVIAFFTKMIDQFISTQAQQAAVEAGETEQEPVKLEVPIIDDFSFFTLANTYKENDDLYQEGIMRPKTQ